ncbi:(Fe-S)-binding protein [Methylovulum psychrotolerans]|uniref:Glycolate oxidase iron-sulfur subunit n=1 Tax=Methylovulum psychrotolerans TaxID=1704499 RepID=A0A2S5CI21_9GAMM|nr:(Fe-S)-binding protein [Methylovulum psychrotolerans]POZ50455.1 (Fe-S)-binding protein [Methylovulum psychrotolerans]
MFEFMDMDFNANPANLTSGPYIPDAGECLRCGLCVSTCPTFRLQSINEETPRQRLRTISKITVENQTISTQEREHLDNCLQCRACEAICPSQVAYGDLFDQTQALLAKTPPWQKKLAFWFIAHKAWRNRLLPLLSGYLKSGLQKPLRRSGLLDALGCRNAESLLTPPALTPLKAYYPSPQPVRGTVALFTGCLAEYFDRTTLQAATRLLNAIGYDVTVPAQQGCCGAIHQHNGAYATDLIEQNLKVFNALAVDAVVYAASGCGAMLDSYKSADSEAARQFQHRLQDINAFLLQHWPDSLQLRPLGQTVAVHEPCSQRHVLKNQQNVYKLLQKIPGLTVLPLADNAICCGAGGSYMLTHPDNAAQLRKLKQQAIANTPADGTVSSNFGCTIFLNADGLNIGNPLQLLAQQLPL